MHFSVNWQNESFQRRLGSREKFVPHPDPEITGKKWFSNGSLDNQGSVASKTLVFGFYLEPSRVSPGRHMKKFSVFLVVSSHHVHILLLMHSLEKRGIFKVF